MIKDVHEYKYLKRLEKDVFNLFNELWAEEEKKGIRFSDYRRDYVGEDVPVHTHRDTLGMRAEEFIRAALAGEEGVRVTNTTDVIDTLYGADLKIHEDINGKAASLYVDIKLNTGFDLGVKYLTRSGDLVQDSTLAAKFTFSFGSVYFGIKERHYSFFKYEKPVAVLYISNFKFVMQEGEMTTLAFILNSINKALVDKGYPYRASQKVFPNRRYT